MPKDSIVMELQRDTLDRGVLVSDLLRKALLVATKLGVRDLEEWIGHELNGYSEEVDVPEYRRFRGQLKAFNPHQGGWIPLLTTDAEALEALSIRSCGQRAAELEHILRGESKSLSTPLPPEIQVTLQQSMNYPAQVQLFVSPAAVAGVLDEVRNVILKWAMKLEQDGILGEGLSFTREERETASKMTTNVNNFFGSVHHSQIQQDSESSPQIMASGGLDLQDLRALLGDIKANIDSVPLSRESKAELRAELATVESQVESPRPKPAIIREGLRSVRHILEGAAGKLAVDWIPRLVGFLSQLGGPIG